MACCNHPAMAGLPGHANSICGRKAWGPSRARMAHDHEKALWAAEPRAAMREIGVKLLKAYPERSQDLNAIEAAWRELRARLCDTEPRKVETRKEFIQRLRQAVPWANANREELVKAMCED